MPTVLQLDMVPIATRSLRTMLDIAGHLKKAGVWHGGEPIEREVGRMVKRLFDLLAWSDGQLDASECRLLAQLGKVDDDLREVLDAVNNFEPANPLHEVVPPLIEAAVRYDRRHQGRLAHILVDCLDTLGYAIIAVNGVTLEVERGELALYVDNLRGLTNMLVA